MKIASRMIPAVALRLDRTARPTAGERMAGRHLRGGGFGGDPGNWHGHGYRASLVRGSSSAVRISASRIANSTAKVIIRNRACISG